MVSSPGEYLRECQLRFRAQIHEKLKLGPSMERKEEGKGGQSLRFKASLLVYSFETRDHVIKRFPYGLDTRDVPRNIATLEEI